MLQQTLGISKKEWPLVRSSFLYFFFLMSSYFILRPVRDEMGIQAGIENMKWLFTGTFLVMLIIVPIFGYLMKSVPRRKLLINIYLFFAGNILLYYLLFQWFASTILSATFFIWLSVFNLFVLSIFWSFNADIFNAEQARRLFGPIAAGGSTGAICGPLLASTLVGYLGFVNLLLISCLLLLIATYFLNQLIRNVGSIESSGLKEITPKSIWQGLILMWRSPFLKQIGLFILFYTTISTFLYFEQAHIISKAYSTSAERTWYFGTRDLLVNSLTLIFQFFVTERIIRKIGVAFALMLVPLIASFGFLLLGIQQSVITLLIIQVLYRSLNFSIQKPSREMLFTRLSVHEKYNSKNFIDTVIYRGGDALSGWLFVAIAAISSLQMISFLAIPLAIAWMLSGLRLGNMFNSFEFKIEKNESHSIITKKSA